VLLDRGVRTNGKRGNILVKKKEKKKKAESRQREARGGYWEYIRGVFQ